MVKKHRVKQINFLKIEMTSNKNQSYNVSDSFENNEQNYEGDRYNGLLEMIEIESSEDFSLNPKKPNSNFAPEETNLLQNRILGKIVSFS